MLIVEIKVPNPDSRFRRATKSLGSITIDNVVGLSEAPYRSNYIAKYFTPTGKLVETVEIADYERTNGIFNLLRKALNTSCPTQEQFREAELCGVIKHEARQSPTREM